MNAFYGITAPHRCAGRIIDRVEQMSDGLLIFARKNNLQFSYVLDDEEKIYHFRFQDQDQTWAYSRAISKVELEDMSDVAFVWFYRDIIKTLKQKVPYLS